MQDPQAKIARLEAALAESEKTLEEMRHESQTLVYHVSHDLRAPLRHMKSFAALIEERCADRLDDESLELLQYMMNGADEAAAMVERLVEYSRVSSRGGPIAEIDSGKTLEHAVDVFEDPLRETGTTVSNGPLPTVKADNTQLDVVFRELIDNSLKFGSEIGELKIEVTASRNGDEWLFAFKDNGPGMDADNAPRALEVFQRLGSRKLHGGQGMGLPICRRIVNRHGGRLWLETASGQGLTVFFTLPA